MEAPVLAAPRTGFHAEQLALCTTRSREFVDLTDAVRDAVDRAGFELGFAVVTSLHTTAAVIVNEHEPELLKDLDLFLAGIAPESGAYSHNDVPCMPGERPNGHAHCQALVLSASVTVPIVGGELALGRWQRIFLVELDHGRPRRVTVSLLGC